MIHDEFAEVLAANEKYAADFALAGLEPVAATGLAVVTCMDSRIEPLSMLGLAAGDAKIMRNAGARVTDDVLRTLVLAHYLLGVKRVMIVTHTQCAMAGRTEAALHEAVERAGGPDLSGMRLLVATDQLRSLRDDVELVRRSPYLDAVTVGGFRYDVASGRLQEIC